MINNYDNKLIKPASVHIRLDSLYKVTSEAIIDLSNELTQQGKKVELPYVIKPGEYLIGKSIEIFKIPVDLCIFHVHNSSMMRIGLQIIGGYGDPGYEGELYFGIKNIGENTIKLSQGISLSKVIVLPVEGKTIPLISRFMGGKLL